MLPYPVGKGKKSATFVSHFYLFFFFFLQREPIRGKSWTMQAWESFYSTRMTI